jgi:starch synthase
MNGIDDTIWYPEIDTKIPKKYSIKNLEDKKENKKALAESFHFKYDEKIPVIGMISRLIDDKGLDLIQKAFPQLIKLNIHLILLGTGDKLLQKFFAGMAQKHSDKFSCFIGFDDELAHLIEAGSDMFLMPSKFEPCGLNQMYSLMYGTVPIARKTGGLADSVQAYNGKNGEGNGFLFEKYSTADLTAVIKKAIKIYSSDKETWQSIMRNGMKSNFTWLNSAKKYVDLYKKLTD